MAEFRENLTGTRHTTRTTVSKQSIDLRFQLRGIVILITFRVIASGDGGGRVGAAEAKTRRSAISQLATPGKLARHRYNIRADASCPGSAGNQTRCSPSHPFHQLTVNLA